MISYLKKFLLDYLDKIYCPLFNRFFKTVNSRAAAMWYVYILKSKVSDWHYLGSTGDLEQRFRLHNKGEVQSTKHYAPFELEAYIAVQTQQKARELEKYFKTGSGRAVLNKRILQSTKL